MLGRARAHRWPLGIVLAAAIALCLPRTRGPIDLRYDAGVYYTVGTSLAEGRGYRLPSEPGSVAEIQYPPALPTVAAMAQTVARTSDPAVAGRALRLLYLTLSVLYAAAVYALACRYLRPAWSVLATLLTVVHFQTLFLSDLLFAELPFALVTTLFLLAALPPRAEGGRSGTAPRAWRPVLLAGVAFLLRTAGVALLAAWTLDELLHRRWRRAALAGAVAALCVGGWQLHVRQAKADRRNERPAYPYQLAPYQFYNVSYQDNLVYVNPFRPELGRVTPRQLAARVPANVRAILGEVGLLVSSKEVGWTFAVEWREDFWARARFWLVKHAVLGASLLPIAGLLILARRGDWLPPLYVLGYLALIVLTPWGGEFERYLTPLRPVLAVAATVTLAAGAAAVAAALGRWAPGRSHRLAWVPAAAVGVVVLGLQAHAVWLTFAQRGSVSYRGRTGETVRYPLFWYDHAWRMHDAAIDWIAGRAEPGDVVITSTPHWVFVRAGLRSVNPPLETDPARAYELMADVPGRRFLVVDHLGFVDFSRRYAAPVVDAFPHRWRLVFRNEPGGSSVYEFVEAASRGLDAGPRATRPGAPR